MTSQLNWQAAASRERERAAKMYKEARQRGMRVRKLDAFTFRVRGWSKTEKRVKDHIVKRDQYGLVCDCYFGGRNRYMACTHSEVVRNYLRRYLKVVA